MWIVCIAWCYIITFLTWLQCLFTLLLFSAELPYALETYTILRPDE
jgi:hypothetical protein